MAESTTSTSSLEADDQLCIICSGPPSNKIVRDKQFCSVLSAYWLIIRADVKPQYNQNFFLCLGCFDMVVELYKTNDAMNDAMDNFRTNLVSIQNKLLKQNIKGIKSRQQKGRTVHKFQNAILQDFEKIIENLDDDDEDPSAKVASKKYKYTETTEAAGTGKSSNGTNTKSPPKRSQRTRKTGKGRKYFSDDDDYEY